MGSSCRTGRGGTPIGASGVLSSHVDKGNGSSSDGTDVSSDGPGGGDSGGTGAAGATEVTGEGSSSWSWGGMGTRVIGHYNGGRYCVALGQLDVICRKRSSVVNH